MERLRHGTRTVAPSLATSLIHWGSSYHKTSKTQDSNWNLTRWKTCTPEYDIFQCCFISSTVSWILNVNCYSMINYTIKIHSSYLAMNPNWHWHFLCLLSFMQDRRPSQDTVYPKKYAHVFCFAVLCCGYTLTDFPISIRITSLALWQSNDCPSASKATLMNMDKYFMWIHYERLHNHNKAKHNKTVCIFLGIYCKNTDGRLKTHICSHFDTIAYGFMIILSTAFATSS